MDPNRLFGHPDAIRKIHISAELALLIDPVAEENRVKRFWPLLREFGVYFKKKPFPANHQRSPWDARCYDQAMFMAKEYGYRYCEGVALLTNHVGDVFRLPHGWCCDKQGRVIDPTMPKACLPGQPVVYLGIPIRLEIHEEWHKEVGYWGMLDGYPDLRLSKLFAMEAEDYWDEGLHLAA